LVISLKSCQKETRTLWVETSLKRKNSLAIFNRAKILLRTVLRNTNHFLIDC